MAKLTVAEVVALQEAGNAGAIATGLTSKTIDATTYATAMEQWSTAQKPAPGVYAISHNTWEANPEKEGSKGGHNMRLVRPAGNPQWFPKLTEKDVEALIPELKDGPFRTSAVEALKLYRAHEVVAAA